ncbi:hypothetical protein Trydic_g3555 [Trypoxylus dichotomus]
MDRQLSDVEKNMLSRWTDIHGIVNISCVHHYQDHIEIILLLVIDQTYNRKKCDNTNHFLSSTSQVN